MATEQEKAVSKREAATLFSPRTPIEVSELFSGRYSQVMKLNSIIGQPGAHAIVYGERGVGKTSLANIAPITFHLETKTPLEQIVSPRINCDGTDSFDALWRKVFRKIHMSSERGPIGIIPQKGELEQSHSVESTLAQHPLTPGEVNDILTGLVRTCTLAVTFDEFDRLPTSDVQKLMADTIKSLSDNNVNATIIVVGVGDSVGELVRGHESVGRHLVEVPLPRMSRDELEKIVVTRLPRLKLTIDKGALKFISLVCAGLPYFTHLLGQHAVCRAIDEEKTQVTKEHIELAMKRAIEDSEREMKSAYYEATKSRHPRNQFPVTLAACALTQNDDFGYFTAASVREALGRIRGTPSDIPDFISHLARFVEPDKGAVLQASGPKHQKRYRFRDPLMQPFVIIRSLDARIITIEHIKATAR